MEQGEGEVVIQGEPSSALWDSEELSARAAELDIEYSFDERIVLEGLPLNLLSFLAQEQEQLHERWWQQGLPKTLEEEQLADDMMNLTKVLVEEHPFLALSSPFVEVAKLFDDEYQDGMDWDLLLRELAPSLDAWGPLSAEEENNLRYLLATITDWELVWSVAERGLGPERALALLEDFVHTEILEPKDELIAFLSEKQRMG